MILYYKTLSTSRVRPSKAFWSCLDANISAFEKFIYEYISNIQTLKSIYNPSETFLNFTVNKFFWW